MVLIEEACLVTNVSLQLLAHFTKANYSFVSIKKVLVEKLLRSCPGIKNIYILLRTKKGLDARQRLEELFNAKVKDFTLRDLL